MSCLCLSDPCREASAPIRASCQTIRFAVSGGNGCRPKSRERQTGPTTAWDAKAGLHFYLQSARDALLWKLEGLSEYDVRRPLTPTGTNLLGLVKHVASMELGYRGDTFARPSGEPLPWLDDGAEPTADMWATAGESREHIVGLHHRAWAHADATIDALALDTIDKVPWWPSGQERGDVASCCRTHDC